MAVRTIRAYGQGGFPKARFVDLAANANPFDNLTVLEVFHLVFLL